MDNIEKYAVELVAGGAETMAYYDTNEEQRLNDVDRRAAGDLALKMAVAVQSNPETFLAWYLSTTGKEVEI